MNHQNEHTEPSGAAPIDLFALLRDFMRIARGKWIYLILTVVVMGAGMTLWRYVTYSPVYSASATYAVTSYQNGSYSTYQDNSLARQTAETAPHILNSDMFRRRLADALEMDQVPGTIQASVMQGTNFLIISVTDDDPLAAHRTLQAVQTIFPEVSESIIGKFFMEPMDESGVPDRPANPRTIQLDCLSGCMLGFVVGFVVVLVLALTNRTVRREEDCVKRINTKCLTTVPRIHQKVRSHKTVQSLNILRRNADPDLVEAFRSLRNRIERSSTKQGCRTLLVTSALPGEGKSTVAVNLALALAQAGKQVALMDCDLRNPTDSQILETAQGPGLLDFLSGQQQLNDCMVSGKDLFGFSLPLIFLPAGNAVADGSAYLHNASMQKLIGFFQTQMDYLILDTPPAGLLTDAGIMAQYADGILFVVREDFAKADKILEGMEHVSQGGCEILGCVLNDDH